MKHTTKIVLSITGFSVLVVFLFSLAMVPSDAALQIMMEEAEDCKQCVDDDYHCS